MRHTRLAALAVSLLMATAACSSSSTPAPSVAPSTAPSVAPSVAASVAASSTAPSASVAPAATGNAVTIANFAFGPAALTVAVGTTVTWTNSDTAGHTVTADDGSFKSGTLGTGATFTQTFAKAGTFAYHCSIHKSMTGTITVH